MNYKNYNKYYNKITPEQSLYCSSHIGQRPRILHYKCTLEMEEFVNFTTMMNYAISFGFVVIFCCQFDHDLLIREVIFVE